MATTVTDFLTLLGIRLNKTISATSVPTSAQVYCVINEISEWLSSVCVQQKSEIGKKTGTITLVDGTAAYDDFVDDIITPDSKGWLLKTSSRDEIYLATEEDSLDYTPSDEAEPDKFYLDGNGNITFLQTPDTAYTAKIPYWYHQTKLTAESYAITGTGLTNPCAVNFASHGFQTNDRVYIASVVGTTQLNGKWFTVTRVSDTQITLLGIDATAYTAWSSAGTVSTVIPFNGIFDNIYIEAASIRFQNIEEYQQDVEQSWLQFLMTEAKKVIEVRKSLIRKVQK